MSDDNNVPTTDNELTAIADALKALAPLSGIQRLRVLNYIRDRLMDASDDDVPY